MSMKAMSSRGKLITLTCFVALILVALPARRGDSAKPTPTRQQPLHPRRARRRLHRHERQLPLPQQRRLVPQRQHRHGRPHLRQPPLRLARLERLPAQDILQR